MSDAARVCALGRVVSGEPGSAVGSQPQRINGQLAGVPVRLARDHHYPCAPEPGISGRQCCNSSAAFSKPSSSRGLPCPVRKWRSTVAMNSSSAAVALFTGMGSGLSSVIEVACHGTGFTTVAVGGQGHPRRHRADLHARRRRPRGRPSLNWKIQRSGRAVLPRVDGGVRPLSVDLGIGGRVLLDLFRQAVRVIFAVGTGQHGLPALVHLMPVA